MKNSIKHTRKNDFHKAASKKKKYISIFGDDDLPLGESLGRYIKGKIHARRKTKKYDDEQNSVGKCKIADRKRYEAVLDRVREYAEVLEYGMADD